MSFKKISLITLLTIFTLLTVIQTAEKEVEESLLSATLKVIFAQIFKPKFMSVSVVVNISDCEDLKLSQEILDSVLLINRNIQVPVLINHFPQTNLLNFIQAKLIFTNSAKNVRNHIDNLLLHNEIQSFSRKYLIVLNNHNSLRKKLFEMYTIFKDFYNFYIIDVVILITVADSLHIYTYKPYKNNYCSFTQPILLRSYKRVPDLISYNDLFPIKTNNYHQCPIKVVLWNIPPFMNLKYKNNTIDYEGFDAEILKDLAGVLNFSIEVVPNEPENFISGDVFRNKTAIGVFKLLQERKVNLSIGFIGCHPRRLQLTTGSTPYFVSRVLIIFKNSKKYSEFYLLLRPFNKSTWCFLITLLLLKSIFKSIFCRNYKLPQSFRHLLRLQWILLIFLLRLIYEGSIFQSIRKSPYQTLPLTIDEVIKQNYSLITDYADVRILHEISNLKNITTIVPGNPQSVLELLDDLPHKTGILSSDIFIAQFMKTRLRNYSDYVIVRDKVSNTMQCIFFPRLSFVAPSVNLVLKKYGMFGLYEKYSRELGFEYLPMTTDQLIHNYNWNSEIPLDVNILKAAFGCFVIMSIVAVLVFLLEVLSLHCRYLRKMFVF